MANKTGKAAVFKVKELPGGSIIVCAAFAQHDLGTLVSLEGNADVNCYLMVLSDHFPSMLKHLPAERDDFQNDNDHIHIV